MNAEAIRELADFIEKHRELDFDMSSPAVPACGTAGCIGGFAAALWPEVAKKDPAKLHMLIFDKEKLGAKLQLSDATCDALCYPDGDEMFKDLEEDMEEDPLVEY